MSDTGQPTPSSSPTPPPLPESWAADEKASVRKPNRKRLISIAVAALVAAALVVAALVVINPFEKLTPEERDWPEALSGRPDGLGGERDTVDKVVATAGAGVYIWSGFDGWHLWIVNGTAADGTVLKGVEGSITTTDDRLTAQLSAPGGSVVTKDRVTSFDLPGDVPLAGVDFEPGLYSKRLTIVLRDAKGTLARSVVTLGPKGKAKAVPVVIERAVVAN